MYLYSITINIDNDVHDKWMEEVSAVHIPAIKDTELVHDYKILKILDEEPNGGTTYSFQYFIKDLELVNVFQKKYITLISENMHKKYGGKFVEFNTLLELVDSLN